MKFTCTKENLLGGLQYVTPITGKSNHLPILSHVLIKANETNVELSSTNLEIALTVQLRAKVDQVGSFTVPAKTLFDYVSLVSSEQLSLTKEEHQLHVQAGKSTTTMHGESSEEFPVIPEMAPDVEQYHLPVLQLKEAFSRVLFAAAKNDIRPELSGVSCEFRVGDTPQLILAATDSYRLAECRLPVPKIQTEHRCILPAKTVAECIRLCSLAASKNAEEEILMQISKGQVQVHFGDVVLISRLIEGTYPDYTQIIPSSFVSSARFPSTELVRLVKAASLFSDHTANAISFELKPEENQVALSSASVDTGKYEGSLDVPTEGDANTIVLNNRYLLEGLNQLGDGEIDMQMNGPDAPCVFKKNNDETYLYIVMPIRQ